MQDLLQRMMGKRRKHALLQARKGITTVIPYLVAQ